MKILRNFCVLLSCSLISAWAVDRITAYSAQLSGPMGTDSGRVIIAGDQFVFVDDVNPDLSFSIPKSDIRTLRLDNGVLTMTASPPFTYGEAARPDAYIRLTDPSSPSAIASWVGVPLEGAVRTTPFPTTTVTTVPLNRMVFGVKHGGDRGRLILGPTSLEFESVNHPDKSRSWTYSQIKEIKRDKNEKKIEIYPFHGDKYEFKVTGGEMAEGLYNILSNRMVTVERVR